MLLKPEADNASNIRKPWTLGLVDVSVSTSLL